MKKYLKTYFLKSTSNEINGFLKAGNKNKLTADDSEELVQEAIQEYSEK